MVRAITLVSCVLALLVAASASARNDTVRIGLAPDYGGPIGAKNWIAGGRSTVVAIYVLNVTNHRISNVTVRVRLPGMKVVKRAWVYATTPMPIRLVPGGATFTIPQVDPLLTPTVGLKVTITAKPAILECPTIFVSYAGKSASWPDRGWCWMQAQ